MNAVGMRIVGKVRFVIPDLASMHALFSNVLIMQLVQPLFMISDVLACLDIREMAETIATDFPMIQFNQSWLAAKGTMIAQILPHVETEHVLIPVLRTNPVHQMQTVELPDIKPSAHVQMDT
jgi:hypothetical protein